VLILILAILFFVLPGVMIVKAPVAWGWQEAMTACDTYFCGPDSGPILTPANNTRYLRWDGVEPVVGYKDDAAFQAEWADGKGCYRPGIPRHMEEFNAANSWELVRFPSRNDSETETVQLAAWLLKAPPAAGNGAPNSKRPRVVIQHGVGSSQNGRIPHVVAYLMRSMGFDCLLPGFRNHGWSGKSKLADHTTWGYDYVFDLLGAWDYAVTDPDGKFGAPTKPEMVGIMGYSLGAFVASAVVGMEPRIPAAWIDSGPYSLDAIIKDNVDSILGKLAPLLTPIVAPIISSGCNYAVGADLGRYTPEKTITQTNCTKPRPIAILGSTSDLTVPIDNVLDLVTLMSSFTHCYYVSTAYFPPIDCDGNKHIHEVLQHTDYYRAELCAFWVMVFDMPCSSCGLKDLPWFNQKSPTVQQEMIDGIACRPGSRH
jgi:pimeloyl-ACP methyl ester carboxylesterase